MALFIVRTVALGRNGTMTSDSDGWFKLRFQWYNNKSALKCTSPPYTQKLDTDLQTNVTCRMMPALYFCYKEKTRSLSIVTTELSFMHQSMADELRNQSSNPISHFDPFVLVYLWFAVVVEQFRDIFDHWNETSPKVVRHSIFTIDGPHHNSMLQAPARGIVNRQSGLDLAKHIESAEIRAHAVTETLRSSHFLRSAISDLMHQCRLFSDLTHTDVDAMNDTIGYLERAADEIEQGLAAVAARAERYLTLV
jgi:hypothetical protein